MPTPAPHAVHYEVAWNDDGIVLGDDGWDVTNDLGYVVHVRRGYLTSYSMELVECPKPATSMMLLAPPDAWAGHSSGTPNPAAIRPMQVESLLAPRRVEVGSVTLAPQAYCQLHYLIARAGHDSPGLPGDLDMVDVSLHLDGTYRARGDATATPFTVHTAVANGSLLDQTMASSPIRVDTGATGARVTVWRRLGAMFDGVDFATMSDAIRAGRVLTAIVDHTAVEIVDLQ